jgi:hypothetical protein
MRFKTSKATRGLLGLLTLTAILIPSGAASAQGGDPHPKKHVTRECDFSLPISIDEASRVDIREVQLYVKVGAGMWQRQEVAPPGQQKFKFRAPADGEYWFTLVTVNNKGVPTPARLDGLTDTDILKVVVDTQPPAFDVEAVKLPSGELGIRCELVDVNPDYNAIKITYRGKDNVIRMLDPIPGQPGYFQVPGPEVFGQALQVSATDLAKNTTTHEVSLAESAARLMPRQAPPAQPSMPAPSNGSGIVLVSGTSSGGGSSGVVTADAATMPRGSNYEVRNAPASLEVISGSPGGSMPRTVLNTTRASLDYRIDQVGPSGVGKVEVWMTTDQGFTWKRLCEDTDRRSPADFELPGDGLYGLRVAVSNGNGFGGRAPAAGEQPQVWIEVDTVPPVVAIKEVDTPTSGGQLDIRWNASDKNLGPDCINLYYSSRREGPWQPIARGVKNDGFYKWAFPRDANGQFFVRVEAVDLAGNVARSDAVNPVVLDMTEPRASVVGVTANHGQPMPAFRGGN